MGTGRSATKPPGEASSGLHARPGLPADHRGRPRVRGHGPRVAERRRGCFRWGGRRSRSSCGRSGGGRSRPGSPMLTPSTYLGPAGASLRVAPPTGGPTHRHGMFGLQLPEAGDERHRRRLTLGRVPPQRGGARWPRRPTHRAAARIMHEEQLLERQDEINHGGGGVASKSLEVRIPKKHSSGPDWIGHFPSKPSHKLGAFLISSMIRSVGRQRRHIQQLPAPPRRQTPYPRFHAWFTS